jgi:F-type H+-transporting ATPase subunit b
MRKALIIGTLLVVLGYCYMAKTYYATIPVPQFELVEVDLLGDHTTDEWKESDAVKREVISHLRVKHYYPPKEGLPLPENGFAPANQPLSDEMLTALINSGVYSVKLRDPHELLVVKGLDYRLRDPVVIEDRSEGPTPVRREIFKGGETLDMNVLYDLASRDLQRIGVVGHAGPISPQIGTMVLVILIFLALNAALQGTLWEPITAILDEREAEIEHGESLAKANRKEETRLEEEEANLRGGVRRAYMDQIAHDRHLAREGADHILKEARLEAAGLRDEALRQLHENVSKASKELRAQVPELGRQIFSQVVGRNANQS